MRSLSATALALIVAAALLGGFMYTAEPAEAVTVTTENPGVEGYKPILPWQAQDLVPWNGRSSWFGVDQNGPGNQGQNFEAAPGSLAIRVEYPGIIHSVHVKDGPWQVESQDRISFVLTNAQPITIRFGNSHDVGETPKSTVQVDGNFTRSFVVSELVRGPGNVSVRTNAGAELARLH